VSRLYLYALRKRGTATSFVVVVVRTPTNGFIFCCAKSSFSVRYMYKRVYENQGASSSLPPVSEAEAKAADEFEFFSALAETRSHCVETAIDVGRVVDALDCGRDDTAVASRAMLFNDDNETQRFLDAERRQRLDEEERDQRTLSELHRDLVEASTSRSKRRTHRAVVLDARLFEEEGRSSASVAVAPKWRSGYEEPIRRPLSSSSSSSSALTRYCSSCRHDLPAVTYFYSDRKTCKACLRYHLRYSRRKRKHEKMSATS